MVRLSVGTFIAGQKTTSGYVNSRRNEQTAAASCPPAVRWGRLMGDGFRKQLDHHDTHNDHQNTDNGRQVQRLAKKHPGDQ